MKKPNQFILALAAPAAFTFFYSIVASAVLPEGDFACQVVTRGGNSGLVLVQTNSKKEAVDTAQQSIARIADGSWGQVATVVECIDRSSQRFKDAEFQTIYEQTPM